MKDRVLIYRYQYWDQDSQSRKISPIYATEEMIRDGLGVPIYTSGIEIGVDELVEGVYVPPEDIVVTPKAKRQDAKRATV